MVLPCTRPHRFPIKKGEKSFLLVNPVIPCKKSVVATEHKFRIGVLGSGKGSNFVALADACATGEIPGEIGIVLSDVAAAGIIQRAHDRNIAAHFIPPGKFRTKLDEEAEQSFIESLRAARVDLIALAGFMRVLKGDFL